MRNGLSPTTTTRYKRVKRPALWTYKKPPYEVTKDGFTYKDIKIGRDGWVNPKMYRPEPYDLVLMRLESKTIAGWWNGCRWEGLRLKESDQVLQWKAKDNREDE